MIRRAWLFFFLIGVALEIVALFVQQQYILSVVTLSFFYAVYHFCYRKHGTALLTFMIWSYWILIGLFCLICTTFSLAHHYGNTSSFLRQIQFTESLNITSISTFIISALYLLTFLYLTIRLRRLNKLIER